MKQNVAVARQPRGRAFLTRLRGFAELTEEEGRAAENLLHRVDTISRGADFLTEGQTVTDVFIVLSGWAMRYCLTSDGRRQITNIALPGDIIGYNGALLGTSSFSAAALNQLSVAAVDAGQLSRAVSSQPGLSRAMAWHAAGENVGLRNQVLRLGRLTAEQRVAHFICEIWVRLSQVDMIEMGVAHFPMTQSELADTLGLSLVHTNRQLQALKKVGLVTLQRDRLVVPDVAVVAELGNYKGPLS